MFARGDGTRSRSEVAPMPRKAGGSERADGGRYPPPTKDLNPSGETNIEPIAIVSIKGILVSEVLDDKFTNPDIFGTAHPPEAVRE